jgi:hypothetical protein
LIKLSSPVTFSKSVQPICLNEGVAPFEKLVDLAGWGKTSDRGSQATKLRTVRMPVIQHAKCVSEYSGTSAPQVTRSMICAGSKVPGNLKDACSKQFKGIYDMIIQKSNLIH